MKPVYVMSQHTFMEFEMVVYRLREMRYMMKLLSRERDRILQEHDVSEITSNGFLYFFDVVEDLVDQAAGDVWTFFNCVSSGDDFNPLSPEEQEESDRLDADFESFKLKYGR